MSRINARRYTENRHGGKSCQFCNWYLRDKESCRVIDPGHESEVDKEFLCRKFERKRGEERSGKEDQVEHQIVVSSLF